MRTVPIGRAQVSRVCIGGNPFSGFSHQGKARNEERKAYYTPQRIHDALREAEANGINTFLGRTDDHIFGILRDYRAAGGTIQWFAQVGVEGDAEDGTWRKWLKGAIELGAAGAYIHGGVVDYWHANGLFDLFEEALGIMREGGVAAGFAGHRPQAHEWIRDHLDTDFQMCSYYNPTDRTRHAQHISVGEKWHEADRAAMLKVIETIDRPVVHYKVFGGGNRPVEEAMRVMGRAMRPGDITCLGVFLKEDPDMIAQDVALFEDHVERRGGATAHAEADALDASNPG